MAHELPAFFGSVINTISERELLTNFKHPLFNLNEFIGEEIRHSEGTDFRFSDLEGIKVAVIGAETIPVLMEKTGAHKRIRSWITANQSEFILIRQKYFSELMWYFQAFPEDYEQIFINYKDKEAVYAVR